MNKIDVLVATVYDAFAAALANTCLAGAPVERDRSTDRAIEALAGYALGVFASHVATRLSLGADLLHAGAIRAALYREIGKVSPATARFDSDLVDERVVTAKTLRFRFRVAERLRASRADCVRIVEAMVSASGAAPVWLSDLARGELVALRFTERVEEVWTQLHKTSFEPPPVAKPAYYVVEIR